MSAIIWMLISGALIIAEVFASLHLALLFAGLAALTTGGVIAFGLVDDGDVILQLVIFFAATTFWAAILWKPLLKRRAGSQYNDLIGKIAIAESDFKGNSGKVKWSGTIMNARLASDEFEIKAGEELIIKSIEGNILTVKKIS